MTETELAGLLRVLGELQDAVTRAATTGERSDLAELVAEIREATEALHQAGTPYDDLTGACDLINQAARYLRDTRAETLHAAAAMMGRAIESLQPGALRVHPAARAAVDALHALARYKPTSAEDLAALLASLSGHRKPYVLSGVTHILNTLACEADEIPGINPDQAVAIRRHLLAAAENIAGAGDEWIDWARADAEGDAR